MILRICPAASYTELKDDVVVLIKILVFLVVCLVSSIDLLVAQLGSCAVIGDVVGYVRIAHMKAATKILAADKASRWKEFAQSLKFRRKLEFYEGDVGSECDPKLVAVICPAAYKQDSDALRQVGGPSSLSATGQPGRPYLHRRSFRRAARPWRSCAG